MDSPERVDTVGDRGPARRPPLNHLEICPRLAPRRLHRRWGPAPLEDRPRSRPGEPGPLSCQRRAARSMPCAIVSGGYSPALGFLHNAWELAFAYDVADSIKPA